MVALPRMGDGGEEQEVEEEEVDNVYGSRMNGQRISDAPWTSASETEMGNTR